MQPKGISSQAHEKSSFYLWVKRYHLYTLSGKSPVCSWEQRQRFILSLDSMMHIIEQKVFGKYFPKGETPADVLSVYIIHVFMAA